MCGIAGIHLLDTRLAGRIDTGAFAAELLRGIDDRGGDATGYAAVDMNGEVTVQKAAVRAGTFLRHWRGIDNDNTRTVLLHTRFATQGAAEWPENNHPVQNGNLWVVHNGVVQNDGDVFGRTDKRRNGLVDSEAIPAVIAEAGWNDATAGLATLDGSFAIAAVDATRPGEVLLARAGWSPLVWITNGRILAWASTEGALLGAWGAAIGTRPGWKKTTHAVDGDVIRVHGADVTRGRFTPYRKPYTAPAYTAPRPINNVPTCQPLALDAGPTVQVDERADERRYGRGFGFGFSLRELAGGALAPDRDPTYQMERCACCHEWTLLDELREIYGEDCCSDCYGVLSDELGRTIATGPRGLAVL